MVGSSSRLGGRRNISTSCGRANCGGRAVFQHASAESSQHWQDVRSRGTCGSDSRLAQCRQVRDLHKKRAQEQPTCGMRVSSLVDTTTVRDSEGSTCR